MDYLMKWFVLVALIIGAFMVLDNHTYEEVSLECGESFVPSGKNGGVKCPGDIEREMLPLKYKCVCKE